MFARVVIGGNAAAITNQLVGDAGHRGHHHGNLMATAHFRFHLGGGVFNAFDVADGRAAEFHYQ